MVIIPTRDGSISNFKEVFTNLVKYFCTAQKNAYLINLNREGPCLQTSGIENLLANLVEIFKINPNKVTILTSNLLKSGTQFTEVCENGLVEIPIYQNLNLLEKNIKYKFGHFIGRSNWQRLWIATHLYTYYKNDSLQSFHFNINDDFHSKNTEFELLLEYTKDYQLAENVLKFLNECPIGNDDNIISYPILHNNSVNIRNRYKNIFLDLVCETYFSGNTFFPTEKTWRPIETMTPFIVQGPQFYLKNLKMLGFKTFDTWWSEDYDNWSFYAKVPDIIKLIETISKWSNTYCKEIYLDMLPTLEHNRKILQSLSWKQISQIKFIDTISNV